MEDINLPLLKRKLDKAKEEETIAKTTMEGIDRQINNIDEELKAEGITPGEEDKALQEIGDRAKALYDEINNAECLKEV